MQFRLLGALEVGDDGAVVKISAGKSSAILTVLLLRANRAVSPDELIDALWGDRAPPNAKNEVQVYVSKLRKTLGPNRIDTNTNGYRLRVDAGELDIERFEDLATGGAAALARGQHNEAVILLNRALRWWRGPVLAGSLASDFTAPTALRLEERRDVALEDRIDALLGLGRDGELVPELEALVAAQPLRERRRAQLILALYRSGQQAAALRACDALRVTLRDELGLDPSPDVVALEAAILQQSASLDWLRDAGDERDPVPTNLPHASNAFVDRSAEQVEVRGAIRRHRLVTLLGPGGVGKTRLAVELGWEIVRDRAGAAWFVDVSGVATARELEGALARAFDLADEPERTVFDLVSEFLGDARMLLILDGCERMGAAAHPFIAEVLERCRGMTIVATSRERIGTPEELTWTMRPLGAEASAELFVTRAVAADPRFEVRAGEQDLVDHVCAQLDGIPLAIELAAARTPYLALDELDRRLTDRFELLRGDQRVAPRHRTLHALIEWSYEMLSDAERTVFRRFSTFLGSASIGAAEAVCSDNSDGAPLAVLNVLVDLVGRSLMTVTRVDGVPRYRMLDTIREFAHAQLDAASETESATKAHRRFFLRVAEDATIALESNDKDAIARCNADRENLDEALKSSIALGDAAAVRFVASLWPWWATVGFLREGLVLADAALACDLDPSSARARAMLGSGRIAEQLGDFDAAGRRYEEAITIASEVSDRRVGSHARGLLGHVAARRGDIALATELHAESLRLAEEIGDGLMRLRALINVGNMDLFGDRRTAAAGRYAEALALARDLDVRSAVGLILNNYASIVEVEDPARALAMRHEALEIATEIGDRAAVAGHLANLGDSQRKLGDLPASRRDAEAAIVAYDELADPWGVARSKLILGATLREMNEIEAARTALEAARDALAALGDPFGELAALEELGLVAARRGLTHQARTYFLDAVALAKSVEAPFSAADALFNLAGLERDTGDFALAHSYLLESRALYAQAERPDRVSDVDSSLEALRVEESAAEQQ